MAGATIKIEFDDVALQRALSRLVASSNDLAPAFRGVGEMLLRSHEERFARQVDSKGRPWQELSPEYKKRKPRNKNKILTLYGHLRRLVYQASGSYLDFGSPWIYAATQFLGDPRRGIPARDGLGLSAQDEADTLRIIAEHVGFVAR